MPAYDSERYSPAAAVAIVSVRDIASGASVDEVSMVLDSGKSFGRRLLNAIELKPGIWGFKIDLRKLGQQ